MTTQQALNRISTSTAEAAVEVLRRIAPGQVEAGEAAVVRAGTDPLDGFRFPAISAAVSYVAGVQGGNVCVMPVFAARRLAAAMMEDVPADGDAAAEVSELELSAIGEAMNQMMAAASASTSTALGQEVEIAPPAVNAADTRADINVNFQGATRATMADVTLFGEECRLIQLIPTAFTMRMTQAFEARTAAEVDDASAGAVREALREVPLRVWAELGRARLRSAEAAALADGAIVELDRGADDPIDVYVNGSRIAVGRLIAVEENEWAVRLDHVFPTAHTPPTPKGTA